MEEQIETKAQPQEVWRCWEKAHSLGTLQEGQTGKNQFPYKILNVKNGESFSVQWKALFVRIIFSHTVMPTKKGSSIHYKVELKGLFAWPTRLLLRKKIQKNLSAVLHSFVKELDARK